MSADEEEGEKCDCENCVRARTMDWRCKIGFHKFEKDKYTAQHIREKFCERCENWV